MAGESCFKKKRMDKTKVKMGSQMHNLLLLFESKEVKDILHFLKKKAKLGNSSILTLGLEAEGQAPCCTVK